MAGSSPAMTTLEGACGEKDQCIYLPDEKEEHRRFPRTTVMPGLDPGIHGFDRVHHGWPWMAGSSPAMTI